MALARPLALAASLGAVACVVLADEASDVFNSLFGDDVKRVAATPSHADDVALAGQLLGAAKTTRGQPALLAVTCEKCCELAERDPAGYATALAAMDLLASRVPAKQMACRLKCVAICQRQYAAAHGEDKVAAGEVLVDALGCLAEVQTAARDFDAAGVSLRQALTVAAGVGSDTKEEVQARLADLASRQQGEKRVTSLKARLAANAKDTAARAELVELYLVEMDDPAGASAFLDESLDEATRKYVPAAAKGVELAPELACLDLGAWYRGLADKAPAAAGKAAMLCRARAYYGRFLELHAESDLSHTAAALALKRLDDALEKLGPAAMPPAAAGGWVDCLRLVDLRKHAVQGKWEQKGGTFRVAGRKGGCDRLAIPVEPTGGYELEVSFVRTAGDDAVVVCFPVGPSACRLGLSASGGEVSGLDRIDRQDIPQSPAAVRPGALVNGQVHVLRLAVRIRETEAEIVAALDGKPCVRWQGPTASLQLSGDWRLPDPKCPALGAGDATVEFRLARMRPLSGRLVLPEGSASAAVAAEGTPPGPARGRLVPLAVLNDKAGWRPVFNGKDLAGLEAAPDEWAVEAGGVLAAKRKGYLWIAEPCGDFVLDLEFKLGKFADSGIILRAADRRDPLQTGLKVQLLDSSGMDRLDKVLTCGAIGDCLAPTRNAVKRTGEWNRIFVVVRGARIQIDLNNETVVSTDLSLWTEAGKNPDGTTNYYPQALRDVPRAGYVGLQGSQDAVWFRNLRIRPL